MQHKNTHLNRRIKDIVIESVVKLASAMPFSTSQKIGKFIGNILFIRKTRPAFISQRNIDMCFPQLSEPERLRLTKSSISHSSALLLETPAIWLRGKSCLTNIVTEVVGLDIIENAKLKGKGIIYISPHLGNWELLGIYLAQIGSLTCLFQPPKNKYLCNLIKNSRTLAGIKLAPTNQRGVSQLLKTLKAGGSIGILPDQVPDAGVGICSEFYNQPAKTMTLTSNLLKRTNATAVMAFAQRQDQGFKIVFKSPASTIYSEDLEESVKGMNLSIEDCIKDAPEQYCWEYQRLRDSHSGVDPYR